VGGKTYSFAGLVVERSGHVNGARHVLDSESSSQVTAGDFVTDFRGWRSGQDGEGNRIFDSFEMQIDNLRAKK
jgi:hypothetical protein